MNAAERVFDRVVIIIFENEYRNDVMRNPYMRSLAASGIDLATYFGVMHPSNTNYVASIAGETCSITADPLYPTLIPGPPAVTAPAPIDKLTVVDRIRQKGLEWRAYMESYNTIEFPPQLEVVMEPGTTTIDPVATAQKTVLDYPPYLNMHNPFVRFQSIFGDREQWKRIGTLFDFLRDCLDGTLPEYSWITPGIWGDGHWLWGSYDEPPNRAPVLVDQAAKWLQNFFSVLRFPGPDSRVPPRTLVVVTFDEAEFRQDYQTVNNFGSDYDGPNQVYTVLLGDTIAPGRVEGEGYSHYSLLRTIERNFGLEHLGKNDAESNSLRFLWNERFRWGTPASTPIDDATFVAAAGLGDTLHVVYGDAGAVHARTLRAEWSQPAALPAPSGTSAAALAACGNELILVCRSADGLSMLTSSGAGEWSQPVPIGGAAGAFALTSFTDYGDGTQKVMLVYAASGGNMQSQTYANGTWSAAATVGQQTDGAIAVAALGTSLFAIYKAPGTNGIDVISYNTAPFNVVTGTQDNDSNTTQYAWSPTAFPVAHFSFAPARNEPDAPEPVTRAYEGAGPFAAATLDGVVHLAHPAVSSADVMTETFSVSGIFTPLNPVNPAVGSTGSNGWGTLAEAGWSLQVPIRDVKNASDGAMAMARFGSTVALLSQKAAGGALAITLGRYERS